MFFFFYQNTTVMIISWGIFFLKVFVLSDIVSILSSSCDCQPFLTPDVLQHHSGSRTGRQ